MTLYDPSLKYPFKLEMTLKKAMEERVEHNSQSIPVLSPWFPGPSSKCVYPRKMSTPLISGSSLFSAYPILQSHIDFFGQKLSNASSGVKSEILRIVNTGGSRVQGGTFEKATTTDDILNRLGSMPLEHLSSYVESEIGHLQSSMSNLQQRRSRGVHKASMKAQKFVTEFDRFLKAYSGVVNIVSSVDAQYGSVASATLTLLFSVSWLMHLKGAAH
ncbi:hypothetical protein BDV95DRAFT_567013 [Massariosphaeria phaeospora]|uniref:Uncharacterized protein n=1 Tax=Massariosphaeria phaeospora TaxID=100035 RepID=A0A7C8MND5_9PLEO|nr:hypothetical protein BDV95DRAFT_567013 [Massariosphaeria phaeospora]